MSEKIPVRQKNTPESPELTPDMQEFYERADDFINLANGMQNADIHAGKINASMLYATARFSAWTAGNGFVKGSDYAKEKADIVAHFTKNFEKMLADNIDNYAENFQEYMQIGKDSK